MILSKSEAELVDQREKILSNQGTFEIGRGGDRVWMTCRHSQDEKAQPSMPPIGIAPVPTQVPRRLLLIHARDLPLQRKALTMSHDAKRC